MTNKLKQKEYLLHEAKDRLAILLANAESNLVDHKGLKANKKAYKLFLKATSKIHDAYNALFDKKKKKNGK